MWGAHRSTWRCGASRRKFFLLMYRGGNASPTVCPTKVQGHVPFPFWVILAVKLNDFAIGRGKLLMHGLKQGLKIIHCCRKLAGTRMDGVGQGGCQGDRGENRGWKKKKMRESKCSKKDSEYYSNGKCSGLITSWWTKHRHSSMDDRDSP